MIGLFVIHSAMLAQDVNWFEGESKCYDYWDFTKAKKTGYYALSGEYAQIGDYTPLYQFPATYERTFEINQERPIVIVHAIVHLDGDAEAEELVNWSIPELNCQASYVNPVGNPKVTVSDYRVADLSTISGNTFTFKVYARDCSWNIHAGNMRFALGCLEKKVDKEYCQNGMLRLSIIPAIYSSYKWYLDSDPTTVLSNTDVLEVEPSLGNTYSCLVELDNSCTSIIYSTDDDVSACPIFHHYDTVVLADSYKWRNKIYTQTGVYDDSLLNVCHCDSIYTLVLLKVHNEYDTICAQQTYSWHQRILHNAGTYTDTIMKGGAIDSICTLYLAHWPTYHTYLYDTICQGDSVMWRGKVLKSAGIYSDTITSGLGCDSILSLHLLVNPLTYSLTKDTICQGQEYIWHNQLFKNDTIVFDSILSSTGCDSICELRLVVMGATYSSTSHKLCIGSRIKINGKIYTQGGVYQDTLVAKNGCDSIVTITIIPKDCNAPDHPLNPTIDCDTMYSTTDVMLPYSDHLDYEWFGKKYDVAGVYHDTLRGGAYNGCDSVGTLNLSTIPFPDNVKEVSCTPEIPIDDWSIRAAWSSDTIYSPLVIPLVGDVDDDGTPDILCFASNDTYQFYGVDKLYIIDGITHTPKKVLTINGKVSTQGAGVYGIIKLQNGHTIVAVTTVDKHMLAYDLSSSGGSTPLWNVSIPYYNANVNFADFNNDGCPEIYLGSYIYDAETGTLLASRNDINTGSAYAHTNKGTFGDAHYPLHAPFAADMDNDGFLDLVAGNAIYKVQINSRTDASANSITLYKTIAPPSGAPNDGHTQVADFNMDGYLDVLVSAKRKSSGNKVYCYVWDVHNNTISSPVQIPNKDGAEDMGKSIPFIADIDNDNQLEIMIQSDAVNKKGIEAYRYNISTNSFDHIWDLAVDEDSYSNTMTMFDLDHNGVGELIVTDQTRVRIVNGSRKSHLTGHDTIPMYVMSTFMFGECTIMQYPVVADVDNNGSAEIVAIGRYGSGHTYKGSLNIFTAADIPWAPARSVWNQYMYNVFNVNADLTIPTFHYSNAMTFVDPDDPTIVRRPYNNFFQQATTIDRSGRYVAADLDVSIVNSEYKNQAWELTPSYCNNGGVKVDAPYYITTYANTYRGPVLSVDTIYQILPIEDCVQPTIRIPASVLCADSTIHQLVIAVNDAGHGVAQNGNQQAECDTVNNIITITLPKAQSDTTRFYPVICQKELPYTHPETGTVFPLGTLSGTEVIIPLTNQYGCDSIVQVIIEVNTTIYRSYSDTVCQQDLPYVWRGKNYSLTGEYADTVASPNECDSIFNLYLTVLDTTFSTATYTICQGEEVRWNGKTYTAAGTYRDTLVNAVGCDSLLTLKIQYKDCQDDPNNPLNPMPFIIVRDTLDTTICVGEYLDWRGIHYTDPGVYRDTGYYWFGWDSVYWVLDLKTKVCDCDTTYGANDTTICAPSLPLLWEDSTWTVAGTKTKVLTNAVGCDSIVTLTLYVNQPTTSDTTAVACDSIVWHGITYTMSGDYDYQTTNAAGCDSTRTLHLTIRHASVGTNDTTVCRNDLPLLWEDSTWTDAGVKTKILTNAAGCDSVVTLTLSVNEPTAGDTAAVACSSFTWYGQTYTASGSYTHQLTNAAGCDSTLTLQLTINQPTNGAKDTTVCADALPLLWEDSTWTAAGTKTKVLANAVGCDSIVTLTLYVNLPTNSDTTAVACDSIVWHGVTYTMSGDYDYQTTNAAGCDSTRTLHLTIRHASVGINDTTVCRNDLPLLWEDSTWTDAGVKTKILTNAAGCDSVVTLTLSVNEPTSGDTAAVACTSFTWYGTTYTSSGSYTHMLTNAAGCDSTLTLQLTINQPTTGDTTAYVCAGTDFYWHGAIANDGAQMTLTNAAGCDSVVTLHLITRPVYHQDVNLTVCDKQMPYTWNGITCTQAGDYVLDSVTAAGCDSVVTLHLAVDVFSASDTVAAICRADLPYTWHGKQLHDAGTLKDTMVNSVLCDSIITLTLTVNDPTASDTTATACSSFTWHGTTYTASGDYDYQTTNANGCDSTRTLHLTINQPTTGDTTAYVCAGTDYYWHGTLANDGAQLTLTNAAGCDSVVTLHLITKPVSSSAKDTTVCAEALPLIWADSTWTEAGTKIAILTNASGCDSTITLTLHVNNHCCPDTIHSIAEVNICDTLLPYTWTAAHTLTIDQAGEYSDTLRNDDGCDSILYFLTLTTYTCCAPMEATMQVPDVCADDASMEVTVTMQRGAFNSYRVHYTNAPGNAMPFRDTVINDAPADQSVPVTLTLPVPHDAADRTHYPRPDTYGIAMTLYDACGDSLHLASTTFDVLFPSWLLDQHWDDVIAILNDRYNGGYTFSDIRWLRDGEVIPGERELYIYLPHQLWTTPEEQHHDYAYQALLTRADDGKSILTCPMTPYHIDSTNVLTEPYVAVAPTIVSHENPVVHVMTNTQGTYWIYSLTGKLLRTADYEPCDHEVFDIRLFEAQTMYILVFTPRHETKPLKEKYRAVKVMVE